MKKKVLIITAYIMAMTVIMASVLSLNLQTAAAETDSITESEAAMKDAAVPEEEIIETTGDPEEESTEYTEPELIEAEPETVFEEAVTESEEPELSSEEIESEEIGTEEAVSEETASEEIGTEEAVSEETVSEEIETEETASEEIGTEEAVSEEAVSEETVSEEIGTEETETAPAEEEQLVIEESETETLEAEEARHTHTEVTDPAVEAGLFHTGLTEGSHCSECGEVLTAQEEVPMKELDSMLYVGCTGSDVLEVQQMLYELGYLKAVPDGIFGNFTKAAVSQFQLTNGLSTPDGIFGPWSLGVMRNNPKAYTVDLIDPDDVYSIQQRLADLGYFTITPTGYFGTYTEECIRKFQLFNGLSLTGTADEATIEALSGAAALSVRILSKGCSGMDVYYLQKALIALGYLDVGADGIFGGYTEKAVKSFQKDHGLTNPDGQFGPWTLTLMISEDSLNGYTDDLVELSYGMHNPNVLKMQESLKSLGYLNVQADGIFGNKSLTAVKAFQLYNNLDITGIANEETLKLLYEGQCTPFRCLYAGLSGADVKLIESFLYEYGYLIESADEVYDDSTTEAVNLFQTTNGLDQPDGIFGLWSMGILLDQPEKLERPVIYDSELAKSIVEYAMQWVGVTPYVYYWERNGNSLVDGTDCSGFVYLIYEHFGIYLSVSSGDYQDNIGTKVELEDLRPGDIVVYRYGGHVAIYAGNEKIIHCASPASGTICASMWYNTPTAYVRVLGEDMSED